LREGREAANIQTCSRIIRENSKQMRFDDVILGRRSIRGYKPDPVPKALIEEIIGLAMRAPSSMNTQPWNFYIITGEPLDRIRAGNTERMVAGVPQSREFRTGQAFAGQHRDRQVGVARQLFSAMGIARDDKDGRQVASVNSTRLYA
jgi:nitroreductase